MTITIERASGVDVQGGYNFSTLGSAWMDDSKCHQDEAEETRKRTFDMGVLLNEEIEDEVLVADEEDEGANDYHH